jgi:hypothetical protein
MGEPQTITVNLKAIMNLVLIITVIIVAGLVIDTRARCKGSQGAKGKIEGKSMWSVSNSGPFLFRWNGRVCPGKTACGYFTASISHFTISLILLLPVPSKGSFLYEVCRAVSHKR